MLLNRQEGKVMIMYSTEGGMDIEEVAEHTPDKIFVEIIDRKNGPAGVPVPQCGFQPRAFGRST